MAIDRLRGVIRADTTNGYRTGFTGRSGIGKWVVFTLQSPDSPGNDTITLNTVAAMQKSPSDVTTMY